MSKTKWHAKPIYLAVVLAMTLGLLMVPAAGASPDTDYYVDGTTGDDGNLGTAASPWKTITHAVGAVSTDDTIIVLPDTYDTTLGETFPITVNTAGVTIKSSAGAATTIIAPTSADMAAFEVTAAGVTIGGSGFTITSGGRAGIYADVTGGNGITV